MTKTIETQEIVLKKLKFAIIEVLTPEFLIDAIDIDPIVDDIARNIRIAIKGYVWAESKSAEYQIIKYPADWWQAFKKRWFPGWLVARYPIKTYVIRIDVNAIYPEFRQAMPDQTMKLTILRSDSIEEMLE